MDIQKELLLWVGAALVCAMVVSFIMCPLVKSFAYKIGAIDVPKDSRRMHKKPVPRLGGLAIFLGFMVSILLFVHIDHQMRGILLGAVIIVVLGVVDDMTPLRAKFKFLVQILAALVAVYHGVVIEILTNPNVFSDAPYWSLGWMKYPVTVLWIVGVTNAVNLIDGLDGLASGVSTISAMTMLVIAILVSEQQVAIVMAALAGACLGFMPYNKNPAKMFMGDTGSTFLGYILATYSIQGLFKYYAIVSFAVPFLVLGLPIFDTAFAIVRRVARAEPHDAGPRAHPPPHDGYGTQPEADGGGAVCGEQSAGTVRRRAHDERRAEGNAAAPYARGGGLCRLARHFPARDRGDRPRKGTGAGGNAGKVCRACAGGEGRKA